MELVAKMDHYGKPAWITLMVVGFVLFWPIGLAILAYLIWSGRMGFWKHSGPGRWYYDGARRQRSEGRGWCGSRHKSGHRAQSSSGNLAFDEYREETLRRLEEERRGRHRGSAGYCAGRSDSGRPFPGDLSGYDVCRAVKSDPQLMDIHVMMLTAKGQEGDREVGLSQGADEYFSKPFSPRVILSKVKELLG